MLKVLLIYPSQIHAPSWGEKTKVKPHMVSLFLFLRHHKIDVEVLDLENEIERPRNEDEVKKFFKKATELISKLNFDIVAISCWSSLNYLSSISVADICKGINHRSIIVVGGYHPSALPGDFIYKKSPFDFIVTGEGETALLEICRNEKKNEVAPSIISGTPLALEKQCVDDWKRYKYTNLSATEYIYLSRGCVYNCAFCVERSKGHKTWRSYPVSSSIEKIKEAINFFKLREIQIGDACFGFNKIWRKRFLCELIRHKISIIFWAQTRIDLLDKEDIDLLSKLNFNIEFGLESGSEKMLSIMRKTNRPKAYLKKCEETIAYLNKKEVPHRIYLIFNHPGETLATCNSSVSFFRSILKKHNKISGVFSPQDYAFFPGSQIHRHYDYYKKKFGTVVRHKEWWKERGGHWKLACSIIPSRELSEQPGTKAHWQKAISELNNQCVEKMPLWIHFFRGRREEIQKY
jgi:radical SAM superfamily enzyme YgiQ (UPF0313 family)